MTASSLNLLTLVQLREKAKAMGIANVSKMRKQELIDRLSERENPKEQPVSEEQPAERTQKQKKQNNNRYAKVKDDIQDAVETEGPLEILPEGFGFIRRGNDQPPIYVSASQIQKFKLVTGDIIGGKVRPPKKSEKYAAMVFLESVNGVPTDVIIEQMQTLMRSDDQKDANRYKDSQSGILELRADGFGFLQTENYLPGEKDIYVAANQIRRYDLRRGDCIEGKIKMPGEGEKYDALLYVERVNGDLPETVTHRPKFETLIPIFPCEQIRLETAADIISTRMIDLFCPIGKGQRGMIVAPPKAGKTMLLKEIALGIRQNHPEVKLIILLVDERPEEVTDMKRSVDADIVYSTFDQPSEHHIKAAEIVLERGKRLVEQGKDVVILVDSITRMTRANNQVIEPSGRTLTGGLDPDALYFPKKFFGSARKIEKGGSLTILATALIDTGSRMDDIIYEEFKGTGNMELHLDRTLAERRIFPAIELHRSGTRREDLLLNKPAMQVSYFFRKNTTDTNAVNISNNIINVMQRSNSNEEFIRMVLKRQG